MKMYEARILNGERRSLWIPSKVLKTGKPRTRTLRAGGASGGFFCCFYARLEPDLWGIPFFIWYQFLWVFITVGITAVVYRVRG